MSKPKYDPDEEGQDNSSAGNEEKLITSASHDELMQQLGAAEEKANQYWERILRMQAESENIARRSERDLSNAHKFALDKFTAELLPIVDSLELCAASVPAGMQEAAKSVVEGVDLTLKMFYSAMEKFGINQVNPVGQPFNPEFEQAISMQEDGKVAPNTVLSVLQKGYTLNGRLIRPALVVVSRGK